MEADGLEIGSARHGTAEARVGFNVAEESRLSAASPVAAPVVINAGANAAKKAEKGVLPRMDYDACVPMPDDQVSRLWPRDPQESLRSAIKIFGIHVSIREAGFLIDIVNQMRAVASAVMDLLPVHCGREYCLAIIAS